MHRRAAAWRRGPARRDTGPFGADLPLLAGLPLQLALTHAVRRLARERPEVFDRLGPASDAVLLLCPAEFPLAIRLELLGARSTVCFKRPGQAGGFTAKISGPLGTLLSLFDGTLDADAAFFSRRIRIEGDTAAITALHNALDAAELSRLDLIPVFPTVRRLVQALLRLGRSAARARRNA